MVESFVIKISEWFSSKVNPRQDKAPCMIYNSNIQCNDEIIIYIVYDTLIWKIINIFIIIVYYIKLQTICWDFFVYEWANN